MPHAITLTDSHGYSMTSDNKRSGREAREFFAADESILAFNADHELYACEERLFSLLPDKVSILDLGCGGGRTTKFLVEREHNVVGVDIVFEMVRNAAGMGIGTPFLCADAINLPFADSSFDAVLFSYNGIDYIYPYENRLQCLNEIHRVLRRDGIFILSSHNNAVPRDQNGVFSFLAGLFKPGRSLYMIDKAHDWGGVIIRLTTPARQVKELQEAGFADIKIHPRRYHLLKKNLFLLGLVETWTYYRCRKK